MFMKALDAMGKLDDPFFGNIPPDETVKLVFKLLSQDEDVRGPWMRSPTSSMSRILGPKAACLRLRTMPMMKAIIQTGQDRGRSDANAPLPTA